MRLFQCTVSWIPLFVDDNKENLQIWMFLFLCAHVSFKIFRVRDEEQVTNLHSYFRFKKVNKQQEKAQFIRFIPMPRPARVSALINASIWLSSQVYVILMTPK